MGPDLLLLLTEAGGAVRRAEHPTPARRLDRLRRQGILASPLPGILWWPSLTDSRDRPWSQGERGMHRLLRRHRIQGWQANAAVRVRGVQYFADVLFRRQRLIAEMDGFRYHSDRQAFEDDRRRRDELVLAGYRVLNFTWRQLVEDPEWLLGCIRRGLDG